MTSVVGVTGSRAWTAVQGVWRSLAEQNPELVVHGGCDKGADLFAEQWCQQKQVDSRIFRAKWGDWPSIDRSAGPARNARMTAAAARAYPGMVWLVFLSEDSRGTKDALKRILGLGMQAWLYNEAPSKCVPPISEPQTPKSPEALT